MNSRTIPALETSPHAGRAATALRILLLDDCEFDRRRVRRLLDQLDVPVDLDEASSTLDMPVLLDRHAYDAVLLDYRLPVGDGADAVALVRHHPAQGDCPAIMIAGDLTLDAGAQVMRDKCEGFLPKADLSTARLGAALATAIAARIAQAETEETARNRAGSPETAAQMAPHDTSIRAGAQDHAAILHAALGDIERIIRDIHNMRYMPKDAPVEREGDLARVEQRAIRQWRAFRGALAVDSARGGPLALAPDPRPN